MNKRCSNVDIYEQNIFLSMNTIALLDIEAPVESSSRGLFLARF
jgi:hypothetical protein